MQSVDEIFGQGETPDPEKARVLTDHEIEAIYPDHKLGLKNAHIRQGMNLGNCYFALGLAALREMPIFDTFMKDCVKKIDKGWRITFWGGDEGIDVFEADLGKIHEIEGKKGEIITVGQIRSNNKIDQIIEVAYGRYLKSKHKPADDLNPGTYEMHNKGGFSHHFLEVILGPYYDQATDLRTLVADETGLGAQGAFGTMQFGKKVHTFSDADEAMQRKVLAFLRLKKEHPEKIILTAATPHEGKYGRHGAQHERAKLGQDEMGERLTFMDPHGQIASLHAYGIEVDWVVPEDQSEWNPELAAIIRVINPWDTGTDKRITLNFKDFLEYFRLLKPVRILEAPQDQLANEVLSHNVPKSFQCDAGSKYTILAGRTQFEIKRQGIDWSVTRLSLDDQIKDAETIPSNDTKVYRFGRAERPFSIFHSKDESFSRNHFSVKFRTDGRFEITPYGRVSTRIRAERIAGQSPVVEENRVAPDIAKKDPVDRIVGKVREEVASAHKFPGMKKSDLMGNDYRFLKPEECPVRVGFFNAFFEIGNRYGVWYVRDLSTGIDLDIRESQYGKSIGFGRDPRNAFFNNDPTFSRNHFEVVFRDFGFFVVNKSISRATELYSQPR